MYIVGYATEEEIARLSEEFDIDVEPAEKYKIVGRARDSLMPQPDVDQGNVRAVVFWVDAGVFEAVAKLMAKGAPRASNGAPSDDGPRPCSTCRRPMAWHPRGYHCSNQNCAEFHDDATTC